MNVELLAALIIGILSVARTARLLGFDDYPPMKWLRDKWYATLGDEGWGKIIYCAFCSAPYLAVGMFIWAYFALDADPWNEWSSAWWWFVINGIWGLSYLSSILVAYDQPE